MKLYRKLEHNEKVCRAQELGSSAITQKSTKANFFKLHRKTRHYGRYAIHHSQRLKVKSFLCITKKLLKQVSLDFMKS